MDLSTDLSAAHTDPGVARPLTSSSNRPGEPHPPAPGKNATESAPESLPGTRNDEPTVKRNEHMVLSGNTAATIEEPSHHVQDGTIDQQLEPVERATYHLFRDSQDVHYPVDEGTWQEASKPNEDGTLVAFYQSFGNKVIVWMTADGDWLFDEIEWPGKVILTRAYESDSGRIKWMKYGRGQFFANLMMDDGHQTLHFWKSGKPTHELRIDP